MNQGDNEEEIESDNEEPDNTPSVMVEVNIQDNLIKDEEEKDEDFVNFFHNPFNNVEI